MGPKPMKIGTSTRSEAGLLAGTGTSTRSEAGLLAEEPLAPAGAGGSSSRFFLQTGGRGGGGSRSGFRAHPPGPAGIFAQSRHVLGFKYLLRSETVQGVPEKSFSNH